MLQKTNHQSRGTQANIGLESSRNSSGMLGDASKEQNQEVGWGGRSPGLYGQHYLSC